MILFQLVYFLIGAICLLTFGAASDIQQKGLDPSKVFITIGAAILWPLTMVIAYRADDKPALEKARLAFRELSGVDL